MRPGILLLLRQDPSHGYTLIEDLRDEGIVDESVDPGVVYRYLREMEEDGLLVSEWDTEGPGVPRKVYRLTSTGEEFAQGCAANLKRTRQRLERILALYTEQFPEEQDAG
jgi:poly-beta-hydroxybutyrate-responsive repressor